MRITILIILGSTLSTAAFGATVTVFHDAAEWKSAVNNNFITIDFADGETFTGINDDYAALGATFSSNAHYYHSPGTFPNDEWGMVALGGAWITFDSPQHWIAADHPGLLWIDLYLDGELLYTSPMLGIGGIGNFGGLISSQPFDMVYLFRPAPLENIIGVDDLHFGTFIPAPGALGLLALGALFGPRRQRRRC